MQKKTRHKQDLADEQERKEKSKDNPEIPDRGRDTRRPWPPFRD